jgi:plasmid stabilization system protein ParE
MTPVDFLPEARRDFDESFDWYASQSARAAGRFANAVDDSLVRISTQPELFAAIDERHRKCLVRRFPFRMVYRRSNSHCRHCACEATAELLEEP